MGPAAGLGVAIGPTVGGWLLTHFARDSIFLVNLPVVAAAALAGAIIAARSLRGRDAAFGGDVRL